MTEHFPDWLLVVRLIFGLKKKLVFILSFPLQLALHCAAGFIVGCRLPKRLTVYHPESSLSSFAIAVDFTIAIEVFTSYC